MCWLCWPWDLTPSGEWELGGWWVAERVVDVGRVTLSNFNVGRVGRVGCAGCVGCRGSLDGRERP